MTETPNPHIVDADTLTGEMRPIRRCVLSLGSNLGDRPAKLQGAVDSLADTPDVAVTAVSSVYETQPVGAPDGSGAFLNAVVLLDSTLPARVLLDRCQAVETAFGRERTGVVNAPRTLDVAGTPADGREAGLALDLHGEPRAGHVDPDRPGPRAGRHAPVRRA